jgi:hypothetical protein
MAHERHMIQLIGGWGRIASDDQNANRFLYLPEWHEHRGRCSQEISGGRIERVEKSGIPRAGEAQRIEPSWPGTGREATRAEGRRWTEGTAWANAEEDRAPPLDRGDRVLMQHGEEIAELIGGREGLKESGLA